MSAGATMYRDDASILLRNAQSALQNLLNELAQPTYTDSEYHAISALIGVVDHARRVLIGQDGGYRTEKAQVLVDEAERLLAEVKR